MEAEAALRPAQAQDAAAITALTDQAYQKYIALIGRKPMPMTTDHAQMIAQNQVWVLEQEGQIIAVIEMIPRPPDLYIDNVAVKPGQQGRGLGKRLLAFAEERAWEGLYSLTLCTNERFRANLELYARLGYTETHRLHVQGTDAVYLRKSLEARP